jgi:predicted Zn-ribbon and HTH transcriptional regulator
LYVTHYQNPVEISRYLYVTSPLEDIRLDWNCASEWNKDIFTWMRSCKQISKLLGQSTNLCWPSLTNCGYTQEPEYLRLASRSSCGVHRAGWAAELG